MTVTDTIQIDAPPDVVWDVTDAVELWPEWTPTVTAVERLGDGPLGVGSRVRLKQPGQPSTVWTVSTHEPGRRLTWGMERAGLAMTATHEIEPSDEGTLNHLRVEMSGLVFTLLAPILRGAVRRALQQENRGLKARCEQMRASG